MSFLLLLLIYPLNKQRHLWRLCSQVIFERKCFWTIFVDEFFRHVVTRWDQHLWGIRAGILSTYANFFLSFIRRETSKKHGFTLLRWLVFELSDVISEHFIRSMLKKHLTWDWCFLDAKTTFLAKYVKKCINFALFHENFRKNSIFFQNFKK
jgi:hypothetical protein